MRAELLGHIVALLVPPSGLVDTKENEKGLDCWKELSKAIDQSESIHKKEYKGSGPKSSNNLILVEVGLKRKLDKKDILNRLYNGGCLISIEGNYNISNESIIDPQKLNESDYQEILLSYLCDLKYPSTESKFSNTLGGHNLLQLCVIYGIVREIRSLHNQRFLDRLAIIVNNKKKQNLLPCVHTHLPQYFGETVATFTAFWYHITVFSFFSLPFLFTDIFPHALLYLHFLSASCWTAWIDKTRWEHGRWGGVMKRGEGSDLIDAPPDLLANRFLMKDKKELSRFKCKKFVRSSMDLESYFWDQKRAIDCYANYDMWNMLSTPLVTQYTTTKRKNENSISLQERLNDENNFMVVLLPIFCLYQLFKKSYYLIIKHYDGIVSPMKHISVLWTCAIFVPLIIRLIDAKIWIFHTHALKYIYLYTLPVLPTIIFFVLFNHMLYKSSKIGHFKLRAYSNTPQSSPHQYASHIIQHVIFSQLITPFMYLLFLVISTNYWPRPLVVLSPSELLKAHLNVFFALPLIQDWIKKEKRRDRAKAYERSTINWPVVYGKLISKWTLILIFGPLSPFGCLVTFGHSVLLYRAFVFELVNDGSAYHRTLGSERFSFFDGWLGSWEFVLLPVFSRLSMFGIFCHLMLNANSYGWLTCGFILSLFWPSGGSTAYKILDSVPAILMGKTKPVDQHTKITQDLIVSKFYWHSVNRRDYLEPDISFAKLTLATDKYMIDQSNRASSMAGSRRLMSPSYELGEFKYSDGPNLATVENFIGTWEFLPEPSDSMDPLSAELGVPWVVRRAVEKFIPNLEYSLDGVELTITTHLTLGVAKSVRLLLNGGMLSQSDTDVGSWKSTSRVEKNCIITVQRNDDLDISLYETRCLIDRYTDMRPGLCDQPPSTRKNPHRNDVLFYRVILVKPGIPDIPVNRFFARTSPVPEGMKEEECEELREESTSPSGNGGPFLGTPCSTPPNNVTQDNNWSEEIFTGEQKPIATEKCLLMASLADETECWDIISTKNQITLTKKQPENGSMIGRGSFLLPPKFSVSEVLDFLWNSESKAKYDPQLIVGVEVKKFGEDLAVLYQAFKGQWGVAGRDLLLACLRLQLAEDHWAMSAYSIDEYPHFHDFQPDLVRAEANIAGFDIKRMPDGQVRVSYIFQTDLKSANIPDWITNRAKLDQLNCLSKVRSLIEISHVDISAGES